MDVYKIDQCLSANIGNVPQQDDIKTEVTFETGGSEFNLSFFDNTEDTQGGFSDPGSVGSTSVASPPPELPSPQHISNTHVILQQQSPPTTTLVIKQGECAKCGSS
ncbi:hypothetical protein M8J75_002364 [Diaphorina citri]|nr:hypothetical protein M8J75_002364 [Diaphorina citri]